MNLRSIRKTNAILRRKGIRLDPDPEAATLFSAVPMHSLFTIAPPKYRNITFIKTREGGAELYDPFDQHNGYPPSQTFDQNATVYRVPPRNRQ